MLRAGVGLSSNPSTERAAEEAAAQAMDRAGIAQADLALVFFTVDHLPSCRKLTAALRRIAGTNEIVGSSAAGVLTLDGEIEGSAGLAVMVLAADDVRACSFLHQPLRDREAEIGAALARTVSAGGESALLIAFPDAYNAQPRSLFRAIEESAGFVPLIGAGASEDGSQGKTFQLRGETTTANALCGFSLSGDFASRIGITQGCQPISRPMTITKTQGNLIFEIDDRPAFEIFAGMVKGPLLENLGRALSYIFVGLPADPGKNSVGPGEYLVRNIVGLDPRAGVLAVAEEIFAGERMLFTLRDAQRAREDLGQMLERQAAALGDNAPQLGFYFNCCARGRSLYGMDGIDTAYIRQSLGEFPLIGLFGSFELGPLGQKNHLLAYTGVLTLITDKEF
ncbi:MAG TPA: FIST N-terminal domain-containing protein [Candidatus Binatia bacterium]|jgi:small ligand-binding sensory domain FIST